MKLTPRLKAIADHVLDNCKVADIGSDHGYLVAYLYESGRGIKPIASDINEGPVENALRTLEENNLSGKIEVRLGGGLEPYSLGEVDIAVIAGMGGMLIRDILSEAMEKVEALKYAVLQPMTQQSELRRWLCEAGFEIFNEIVVREGDKFYEIFCIQKGHSLLEDPVYLEIGLQGPKRSPLQDPEVYVAYLEFKMNKYTKIIESIRQKGSEESQDTLKTALHQLEKIREVLNGVR